MQAIDRAVREMAADDRTKLLHNVGAIQLCIFYDDELQSFRSARQQLLEAQEPSVTQRAQLVVMRARYDEWRAAQPAAGNAGVRRQEGERPRH